MFLTRVIYTCQKLHVSMKVSAQITYGVFSYFLPVLILNLTLSVTKIISVRVTRGDHTVKIIRNCRKTSETDLTKALIMDRIKF